ncbi:GNAT family N-acetyltransferase [Candidatus Leptofilum sp.]|uniref:GNAT family N-acetyltransferase n=1 Tax=Candidatus Leptofilum sp. TaxID=3241576 RepID=UPI003B5AB3C9
MSERIHIALDRAPTHEALQVIGEGLRRHNEQFAPASDDRLFAVFLHGENGHILGGVIAKAGRGWLKIGSLWVNEALRGQGYGRQLIETAENEGVRLGCHSSYLDTFSFQTPQFYTKCGYEIFGTLEAFPDEHTRFFMRKSLA